MNEKRFIEIIKKIFSLAHELEEMFPGRKFTPDGHMVGSLGEGYAVLKYKLDLARTNTKGYDAKTDSGDNVQIKTTSRSNIEINGNPDYILAFKIDHEGKFEELFNGEYKLLKELFPNKKKNKGYYNFTAHQLRKACKKVKNKILQKEMY